MILPLTDAWLQYDAMWKIHGPEKILAATRDGVSKASVTWEDVDFQTMLLEYQFANKWVSSGRIVYQLTHSMSAMFALTSCPAIDRLPHEAFAIKIPRQFLPMGEVPRPGPDSWVAVGSDGEVVMLMPIADSDTTATAVSFLRPGVDGDQLERHLPCRAKHQQMALLARRFAANTIAYINNSPANAVTKLSGERASINRFEIRQPRDVIITKEFRNAAMSLVSSNSLAGVRRSLAHVVRGHWRNQPVGEGRQERRMTWVRPHRRGDESLGRVVSRIERITADA